MFELIRTHQLNLMLCLCAMSAIMAILLLITRFLPKKRKWILVTMEVVATLLLGFDRAAYIYSGNTSPAGYIIVRLANFMVFFLTAGVVLTFNFYISDLLERVGENRRPQRLNIVTIACIVEFLMVISNLFTGLYFYFDESNVYHRGRGFLFCYIVPIIGPLIQFSVIREYKKSFSHYIYIAMCLYIFVPIVVGIIQIFSYGLSIVNMAMVLVSVSLYIFSYLDINEEVQKSHKKEMQNLKVEREGMKKLFKETVTSFKKAVELRNPLWQGKSEKLAEIALKIAEKSGMSENECEEVYYSALLYDAGFVTLPDSVLDKEVFSEDEEKLIRNMPKLSSEILEGIKEFPYLSKTALYCFERYDGQGYPEGLKGEQIPVIARIIAVASAYIKATFRTKNRNSVPMAVVREEFVKEGGGKYDPLFANLMVQLMDAGEAGPVEEENYTVENEVTCDEYRTNVSVGIPVLQSEVCISFYATLQDTGFSAPSIILFDSFDRRVHTDEQLIEDYRYIEYGELWFDGHSISTNVRNMEVQVSEKNESDNLYKITAGRYEDHVVLTLESGKKMVKAIIALPDISRSIYIGLTGEHCKLENIQIDFTAKFLEEKDIPRIADQITFINRIEADIPNVQINSTLSAYTEGISLKNQTSVAFHTMSFPDSSFVWHCPYIVLFYSEDGKVGGKNYREYALVKLNGEDNGSNDYAENHFVMKKDAAFKSWEVWKECNKAGLECEIEFQRQGNSITMTTYNLGIHIENTTLLHNAPKEVYVALTGDQCALTDIRIR